MQVYQGYQLVFFTQQNRKLEGMTVAEWLLKTAKDLGIPGATMSLAQGGYGRDGKFHSAHFFELAEVPEEVLMGCNRRRMRRPFCRNRRSQTGNILHQIAH